MTTAIAAAVAIVPSTLAGVGIAIATGKAAESIARQPEAAGQIRSSMLIGCGHRHLRIHHRPGHPDPGLSGPDLERRRAPC